MGVYSYCLFFNKVCVCDCVFVCVNPFSIQDFSGATGPRILKFDTNIEYDFL